MESVMNGTAMAAGCDLDRVEVRLLSADELFAITGGGPIAIGCLLAVGGASLAVVGVVVGVALYAVLH